MPVRKIPKNHRSVTGRVARAGGEDPAAFESTLERDLLALLEFDLNVARYCEQPVTIPYKDAQGKDRSYTPDCLVTYRTDVVPAKWLKPLLVEVKYRDDLWEHWAELRPRFKAALRYAHERGWQFKILTEKELRTPYLANAKFLNGYKTLPFQGELVTQLQEMLYALRETDPRTLLAALRKTPKGQAELLPTLWMLVANQMIETDLTLPLTMTSRIWTAASFERIDVRRPWVIESPVQDGAASPSPNPLP